MQDETTWMASQTAEESVSKERYDYFTRPEPRENMSDIYIIDDPISGPGTRVREVRIGMVRNAKDEDKQVVTAYLDPYPHTRLDTAKPLQGWYQSKHNESPQSRPRPCMTDAILTEPYGGWCAVSCQFCYINNGIRGYRGTGLITVPLNYGDQIRKQLTKMRRSAAGYFSSFTDPFTPLETIYHNTEEAAKAFVDVGLPVFFLSRLPYPDWAVDLLTKNKYSYAQKSLNTGVTEDFRKLSPGALSLDGHLEEISKMKSQGIYVSIQVNPIVAGVTTHSDILLLFKRLSEAGADHVIVKFVEAAYSWAPALVERIKKVFGIDRGAEFEKLFTQNIGSQRTIEEEYRVRAHRLYSTAARRLGLTYSVCYEYEYERNAMGEIISKTGVSLARRFTTSAQCHGHKVPMFTRDSAAGPFREVEECPPTGCLYCADDNAGEPRCGDKLAGEAVALRMADLKYPIGSGPSRGLSLPMA